MRYKYFYIILCFFFVSLATMLLIVAHGTDTLLFGICAVLVIIALIFLIVFYRHLIRPLRAITGGMDLLQQQDMTTFLAHTGQPDTDVVVDTFNTLLRSLRNEHLRTAEQSSFLNLLIQASTTGVILVPLDGEPVQVNPAARRMLTPELQSRLDSMPLGTDETIRLSSSQVYRVSHLAFTDGGRQHPFFLIQSLTEEMAEAERAAYERVIRMIAHEVNGTVACISSTLDTIGPDISNPQSVQAVGSAGERLLSMAQFVTRFADVVKLPDPRLMLCDLNEEMENYRPMITHMCHTSGIRLVMPASDSAAPVRLDPVLFQQVVINIVKNSIESIMAADRLGVGEGLVEIVTHGRTLVVTDNGQGIEPAAAANLFTPFFTTKSDGQGIGLLITRHVLRRSGCRFSLSTDPSDHLTRFAITFPNP